MPLLIVRVTPVKSQQGLTNHADFWTHKADAKLTWMETIKNWSNSTLWGKGKFQLWIFTLDKNRKILYFVVHAGQGYTYLSQTPNIRLTYLHILHIWSHIQGVGYTFSILQGINATVIIPSAKISNDFGNPCIALDQGTFAFFLFFDTITNHHRIDTIKSQIIPLKFFQYPTSIRLGVNSEMMIFRRTLSFFFYFLQKALFWTHEPPIFQTIEFLTDHRPLCSQKEAHKLLSFSFSFFFINCHNICGDWLKFCIYMTCLIPIQFYWETVQNLIKIFQCLLLNCAHKSFCGLTSPPYNSYISDSFDIKSFKLIFPILEITPSFYIALVGEWFWQVWAQLHKLCWEMGEVG